MGVAFGGPAQIQEECRDLAPLQSIRTIGNDLLVINPVGTTGAVNVLLNSVSLGNFTLGSGGRIGSAVFIVPLPQIEQTFD